ncbi:hypothetical protein HYALB_00001217 [Hymenoscyphus albidus]|uniref:Uncharacterized protein n=1 Tax=Hymenoscyphus albidus TaxID=595503 RepID=A0A9N9PY84_9HELO|nr:hypothetical protein HYALB_00001217 [Hymenoscyphus albidus]
MAWVWYDESSQPFIEGVRSLAVTFAIKRKDSDVERGGNMGDEVGAAEAKAPIKANAVAAERNIFDDCSSGLSFVKMWVVGVVVLWH